MPPKRPVYLTQDEFRRLISAIDHQWFKDVVRFAIATMMRAGEIVNLEWDSVDFDRRLIRVENSRNEQRTNPELYQWTKWFSSC